MKHLTGILLLITLPGCMMLGDHGMMNHSKAEKTKITKPDGKTTDPVSEQSTHQH